MSRPHIRPFTGVPNRNIKWRYEAFFPKGSTKQLTGQDDIEMIFGYGNTPEAAVDNMWLWIEMTNSDIHK